MKLRYAMLAASFLTIAQPVSAQDDGTAAANQVIVSGQRQAYRGLVPVADIPQAITLLVEARLDEAHITRLADALDLSSSITRQNNFGGL